MKMLRAGIANDWRRLRYHFWRMLMRMCGWISSRAFKVHRRAGQAYMYYYERAARLDRRMH